VGKFVGVEIEYKETKMGETNKTASFLEVNPFGQVPTAFLDDKNEQGIFESNSIARYVARLGASKKNFYGNDIYEASRIDAFIDAVFSLEQGASLWMATAWGYIKDIPDALLQRSKDMALKQKNGFEQHLTKHKFLVGDSLTLADIVFWCHLAGYYRKVYTAEHRNKYPNCFAFFQRLYELKEFKDVAGNIELAA
jgi:glutathione S-transferase